MSPYPGEHGTPSRSSVLLLPASGAGYFTVEDWLALPRSGQRIELIDGSYRVSPQAATNHQICAGRLQSLLLAVAPEDLEVVQEVNVLCAGNGTIPDVVVGDADVLLDATPVVDAQHVHLVAEVVSPGRGNRRRDFDEKPRVYAGGGIPTFLRIVLAGEKAPWVEVLTLVDGSYTESARVHAGEMVEIHEPFPVVFDPAVLVGRRRSGG